MPFLRIICDRRLTSKEIRDVKALGFLLGYSDPRMIWIESNDGLTQNDVAFVEVRATADDFKKPEFRVLFCEGIAELLRQLLNKSVEVSYSAPIRSVWRPNKAGAAVYGE